MQWLEQQCEDKMVIQLKYGSGLGKGISSLGESVGKGLKERREKSLLQDILNPQQAQQAQQQPTDFAEDEGFRDKFLGMVQDYENKTGEMLEPNQLDMAWNTSVQEAQKQQQQTQQKAGGTRRYSTAQLAEISRKNPQLGALLQREDIASRQMEQKREIAVEKIDLQRSKEEARK